MKSISFDQIKTMLKSMSYSIFTRLRIVEKDIEGIRGKLPTTTEIIFTKGEDGNYTCNIPHTELWEMDADAIGRNARIIDGDKIYGVRGASKNTENLYGNVIQVYADLNVGSYDIPGTPPRTLILTYCIPEIVGTQMIYSEETSGLSNFPRSNIQSRVNIPVLYNGIWRNRYAEFMEENSLTGNMELSTMSPTVKGGAKVGKGLKMDGDALTVDEGEYELIEKIIVGYGKLTAKPSDWETNWTAYFRNTGTLREPVYEAIADASAPTWTDNTYYSFGSSLTIRRTEEPDGTRYNFKKFIAKYDLPDVINSANGGAQFVVGGKWLTMYLDTMFSKNNSTVVTLWDDGGFVNGCIEGPSAGSDYAVNYRILSPKQMQLHKWTNNVDFRGITSTPIETIITIYGVRA